MRRDFGHTFDRAVFAKPHFAQGLDDRLRLTVYLASTGPKPEDSIDLPVRQVAAGPAAVPEVHSGGALCQLFDAQNLGRSAGVVG